MKMTAAFSDRENCPIVGIIIHCMGYSFEQSFKALTESDNISAHFLIDERGVVFELVAPEKNAFHAGISHFANWNALPGCGKSLNKCTIGIEFCCPGFSETPPVFKDYHAQQIKTGITLIKELVTRFSVDPRHILAHSSVSVGRKVDPGPTFPFKTLFEAGLGVMPDGSAGDETPDDLRIQKHLKRIGFCLCPQTGVMDAATQDHIKAYAMQFLGAQPYTLQTVLRSLQSFKYEYNIHESFDVYTS